jgi:carbamoyl-phosphate synthase large subunit
MPKRTDLKSILVIGSGPIVIGQACEFDYSGTQAVKALKEEGYRVILVNSNPATIMTDPEFADRTYIEPITAGFVEKIIARERPDAVLPTIGGQTALNCALELAELKVFERYNVELIGASVEAIKTAEDRELFRECASSIGLESARSFLVRDMETGRKIAKELGFPLVIRPSRTLGGSGGGIVRAAEEFEAKLSWGLECSPISEVLLEESLLGWKEIELEVMRDKADNAVIICSIENLDPMGIHTGDSITVAPIQTLTDKEYQQLRTSSLNLLRAIGVDTGGSNVQFAICPRTGRQIVIEMNPRVSRSSALASKATGFPIAKIAAKLAVGYTLDELPNDITKKTPACFEPSIDYVVVKIPRFTFEKFPTADNKLGPQMKSVGEVMAIGRNFSEAFQKAARSLETGRTGFCGGVEERYNDLNEIRELLRQPLPDRVFMVGRAFALGMTVAEAAELTAMDTWFLAELFELVESERAMCGRKLSELGRDELLRAKTLGFSDARLAQIIGVKESKIRELRHTNSIRPAFKAVDTCAGEFEANTPYFYSTYEESSSPTTFGKKKVIILGGGPNRIGQGLEFDYCCVHAAMALRQSGFEAIIVNCNPETVSTDYDTSDKLYFEPLTLEDVLEIIDREKPAGVIVQYGGQTPLKLAQGLQSAGVPIVGTSPDAIDLAEDRELFSKIIDKIGLNQPPSGTAMTPAEALGVAVKLGFPLVVRPSFVLGGRSMAIIHNDQELSDYLKGLNLERYEHPLLLDRYLDDAIELDVDAVSDGKTVIVAGIIEHIERAGIHSGDSSFILPSATISSEMLGEIETITKRLAAACAVKGLMNVQYALAREGPTGQKLYVLEVNPRASRSVPFVSKVTGVPWAKVGTLAMINQSLEEISKSGVYGDVMRFKDYRAAAAKIGSIAVKISVFPFAKFRGVDTVLGPEMKSTGEVMGIDKTLAAAVLKAQSATGMALPGKGRVFISVKDGDKDAFRPLAQTLANLQFELVATEGTAKYLNESGIKCAIVNKVRDGSPNVVDMIINGEIDLVINTPEGSGPFLDSRTIRSSSFERKIPLFTAQAAAKAAVEAIAQSANLERIEVMSIQEHLE